MLPTRKLISGKIKKRYFCFQRGVTNKGVKNRVTVVSDEFKGKSLMQRHRLIYGLLDDELKNQGLHALTLKTKTQTELEK